MIELGDDFPMPSLDLPVDDFLACVQAAWPLWRELERLGWVDSWAGEEFKRIFAPTLDAIFRLANGAPPTDGR